MANIVGNDISEFQGTIDWPTYKNNSNFVIMRASQGNGYIDKEFGNNRTQARSNDIPHGFYHFANPDLGNTPHDEANFFISLIDGDPILPGEVLALDFEVTYEDAVAWCLDWLQIVSAHYNGIKPLIYMNQDTAQKYDWTPIVEAGYGLWIAAYTGDPTQNSFQGGAWQTSVMQQWTDGQTVPGINVPVDGDVFFGDATQFEDYGYKATDTTPPVNNSVVTPPVASMPPVKTPSEPTAPITETTTSETETTSTSTTSTTSTTTTVAPENLVLTQPIIPDTVDEQTRNFLQETFNWIEALFQKKNE